MIYLTADVHTRIPGHWEQEEGGNELDACFKYLEILKKYKISCTIFINGKCLIEEKSKVDEILKYDIELGGHTYDNFGKMSVLKSYLNRKKYGCVYGNSSFQEKDINKSLYAFAKYGIKMQSWRTHAFASNEDTFRILTKKGIRYVSDLLGNQKPFEKQGIIHIPINIPVDVITIAYGLFRPKNRDPFASCTKGRIEAEEWFEILKKRVSKNEKEKRDSIILLHPITMKVLDDFKLFDKIAKFLSKFKCKKIREYGNED